MQPEERQHRIGEYLQKVEFASLEEIARQVEASTSTVRRDLTILEASGFVRRTHGGARIISPKTDEFTFSARDTHQLTEKEAIGRACAELIHPNQSVIIDAEKCSFWFDTRKFGSRSVLPLCDLACVDAVVTDHAAPAELVQTLRERGINLIVAPESAS